MHPALYRSASADELTFINAIQDYFKQTKTMKTNNKHICVRATRRMREIPNKIINTEINLYIDSLT